ncbi:MAG: biotin/lipoyl-binding protein, partial [Planctomycetaceae bacterium]
SDRQSPSFITRHKRRLQIAAALLIIALLPLQLKIPAAGILEPVQRQRLYAPESGIVTELPVTDGQAVQPGDILVRLRSDDLELQQAELLGALAESQARLSALETAAARGSATLNALSVESEQAELHARILSLEQQRTVLLRRIDSLVLRATTAGTVIGRDLQQRFIGRPLQRGQLLLDVVPAETSWHLQLEIAETDLRHVLRAFQNTPETPVSVSYFTETQPEQEHTTQLATIASAAELNSRGEWKTRVFTSSVPLNTSER